MNIPKFRAWSIEFQQMFDVETINFHPAYRELTGGEDSNGDEILFTFDEVILMQSTGLTDKNGELIFVGDILQHPVSQSCFQVVWIAGYAGFRAKYEDDSTASIPMQLDKGGAVVIGNIHANADLLNDTN